MDSKLKQILLLFALSLPCFGQTILSPIFYGQGGAATYPAITIDGSVHGSALCAGSSTTCAVTIGTPTAGDTIFCDVVWNHSAANTSVLTDNVNSGNYQPFVSCLREASGTNNYCSYYKENVAASSTTVTMTIGTAETNSAISCRAIKGTPATYSADTSVVQSTTTTGTNPVNANSYTPYANNEIVFSGMQSDSGTVTAGTNFALLDNVSRLFPEYWIQTTATSTNGPFSNGTSSLYAIGMSAFGQNHAGTCGATAVIDWNGGTNSGTPNATTVLASLHGINAQSNAILGSYNPGVTVAASGAGLTYNTAAYQAFGSSITCPFYAGSGTGSNTLGLDHAGGGGTGLVEVFFETAQTTAVVQTCISTTATQTSGKSLDALAIFANSNRGNADYVNLQWNSDGVNGIWKIETHAGTTTAFTNHWTTNSQYTVRETFVQAGQHSISIYSGCGHNPTLIETQTANASVSGGGPPAQVDIGYAGNDTWTAGHWYFGAVCFDTLYGTGCNF